jgi:hypothetical protein
LNRYALFLITSIARQHIRPTLYNGAPDASFAAFTEFAPHRRRLACVPAAHSSALLEPSPDPPA